MKRKSVLLLLALTAATLVAVGLVCVQGEDDGKLTRRNYERIQLGMTLGDVEAILGQGEDVSSRFGARKIKRDDETVYEFDVPYVVQGDSIYKWEKRSVGSNGTFSYGRGVRVIHIGFRNGKVCDKDYWHPSL